MGVRDAFSMSRLYDQADRVPPEAADHCAGYRTGFSVSTADKEQTASRETVCLLQATANAVLSTRSGDRAPKIAQCVISVFNLLQIRQVG